MDRLLSGKKVKSVIFDQELVIGGTNYIKKKIKSGNRELAIGIKDTERVLISDVV